jgi:hypothetical protein
VSTREHDAVLDEQVRSVTVAKRIGVEIELTESAGACHSWLPQSRLSVFHSIEIAIIPEDRARLAERRPATRPRLAPLDNLTVQMP